MTHWNYRAVEDAPQSFCIMEVYYDENENIVGWSNAYAPGGSTVEELKSDMQKQSDAIYAEWLHIQETEDWDPKLVPWREDGNYEVATLDSTDPVSGWADVWEVEPHPWPGNPMEQLRAYPTDYPIFDDEE